MWECVGGRGVGGKRGGGDVRVKRGVRGWVGGERGGGSGGEKGVRVRLEEER